MSSQLSLRYGFSSARDLLAKLGRDREVLSAAVTSQCDTKIADSIFNFCVTGHSIKEWVKHDNQAAGSTVESHITNSPVLAACADIGNSSKHKILSHGIRSHSTGRMGDSELTWDMSTISCDSTIPINGFTIRILFDDGSQMELLDFAHSVYNEWDVFLTSNGL